MSVRFPTRRFPVRRLAALAGAALGVAGATGLAGSSSQAVAAPNEPATPLRHGIVRVSGSLTGRSFPTTHSEAGATFRDGTRITIDCKVHGPSVQGNDLWYGIPITGPGRIWVSARYVSNVGPAPDFCDPSDGSFSGTATRTVNRRSGPSALDHKVGSLTAGHHASVACSVGPKGQRWYYTADHSWIDARYLEVGSTVRFCADDL